MARTDEIHSTEKLLKLIRHPDSPKPLLSSRVKAKPTAIPLGVARRRIIGVDIGHTYIKISKVERLSDSHYELADYLDVPLNRPISLKDPEIVDLLRSNLEAICGQDKNCDIWSAIPSSNVETRCFRIPKLPRKQISNAALWTFTQKIPLNQQEDLFDYEVLGDIAEGGVKKTEIMAVKAPRSEIVALKSAFDAAGFPLKGISLSAFAIQNLFRRQLIPHSDQEVCSLFIGRDWSRIAIFRNGSLVLSRGIKAGIRSMVDAIQLALRARSDRNANLEHSASQPATSRKSDALLLQEAQRRFFQLIRVAAPEYSGLHSADDPTETFHMIMPALERLVRQVERTLEHYSRTFSGQGIRRLLIAGQLTANPAIVNFLSQQLEMPTGVMDPFEYGAFSRHVKVPQSESERESFAPSIGLALSSNSITLNFLFPHEARDRVETIQRNNMRILTTCMVCLMLLTGIFSWQERQLDRRRAELEKLSQQFWAFNPTADQKTILALFAKAQQNRQLTQVTASRYSSVAAIQELSEITPANIRLLSTEMNQPANPKTLAARYLVTVEGVIFGNPAEFETILTSYLFRLNNSALFRKPVVQSKRLEYYNAQEVLRFTARLEMP